VNHGSYDGDQLPRQNWSWPQQTWFQERLRYIRKKYHVHKSKDRSRLALVTARDSEYEQKKATQTGRFKGDLQWNDKDVC
jgi:hypothetical protein